ncbi:hypothetical protein LINPERPRIM_LOCUS31676 [Linum perenne]
MYISHVFHICVHTLYMNTICCVPVEWRPSDGGRCLQPSTNTNASIPNT